MTTDLSSESLIHSLLKNIQLNISDNKKELDTKIDKLASEISHLRSTVDRLGIDHIFSDIKGLQTEQKSQDERLKKLENYHSKIMAIGSIVGFLFGVSAIILTVIKN